MNKNFVVNFRTRNSVVKGYQESPIDPRVNIDRERIEISMKRAIQQKKRNKVAQNQIGNSNESHSLNAYLKTIEQQVYEA
ncbi:MAG: hypothetical protein ABIX01_02585 [Chitinophagaceae bacterium]